MKLLEPKEIRYFFAKRPWLRPSDYDKLDKPGGLGALRRRDLSAFVCGWLATKDQHDAESFSEPTKKP